MKNENAVKFVFVIFLIKLCKNCKGDQNNSMTDNRIYLKTGNTMIRDYFNNSVLDHKRLNNSKYNENGTLKSNKHDKFIKIGITPNTFKTTFSSSKIKQRTSKLKVTKSSKRPKIQRERKKGRVFQDTIEDVMHYKLIDNMMFKPLDSNNSVSIVFSDESEITQADVDQAIAGKDGSCIAIPVKRKKDIYKEFLRWAHVQEKNERRAQIQKKVIKKFKNNTMNLKTINKNHQTNLLNAVNGAKNNSSETYNMSSKNLKKSNQHKNISQGENQSTFITKNQNFTELKKETISQRQNRTTTYLKDKKYKDNFGTDGFKAESVEIPYDPDFVNKLHNSIKNQASNNIKRRKRKKKVKKQKQRQTYEGNPADISADDYSAQEMFMINTQKEAMGRRYYQMFVNKTASDFWDNSTLETTKMLEFLIPLGEHLHKTLEKPPPNEGKNFVSDLQMYKTELTKFIGLVKKDKAETRPDVVALLEEPYDHVCETMYNEDEIKIMFGWESAEYEQFEKLLEETRELWFDLQLFHHCYQFVSESTENFDCTNHHFNYTKDEQYEIIKNNTWLPS